MVKYGMVINLQKCMSCGACALACKTENNTQNRRNGQTFNWADYLTNKTGSFPHVQYESKPVLCNHCTNAACVEVCPVTPKAMFKNSKGITLHNDQRCIGCRLCQDACPYSVKDVDKTGAQYSVISYNEADEETHPFFRDKTEYINGCTASGAEVVERVGALPPYLTQYSHPDYEDVRKKGIVEKCILCDHRVEKGEQPYCVVSCPARARVFGDLNDPGSEISKLLKEHQAKVLLPEAGTDPNIFYIRSYRAS